MLTLGLWFWYDLAIFLQALRRKSRLSRVSETFSDVGAIMNPQYCVILVGWSTDLVGCTMKPNDCKVSKLSNTFCMHLFLVIPISRESSKKNYLKKAVNMCPFPLRAAYAGFISFVNNLDADASPLGRALYSNRRPLHWNLNHFLCSSQIGTE